jgi:Rieske Fe-S protein
MVVQKLKDILKNLILHRIKPIDTTPYDIPQNAGAIVSENGKKVAIYRDADGKLHKFSPTCTHLGCLVDWDSEKNCWSCACHGSEFAPTGEVISGPAKRPLGEIS